MIRFTRPNAQATIKDIFLRGEKAERSILIVIDKMFEGKPKRIPPHTRFPIGEEHITIEDSIEALVNGYDIFENTIQQLSETNWKYYLYSPIANRKNFLKIIKKYINKNDIKVLDFFNKISTRSLIVFCNCHITEDTMYIIKRYLSEDRQICIVDDYGVKRYPRKN